MIPFFCGESEFWYRCDNNTLTMYIIQFEHIFAAISTYFQWYLTMWKTEGGGIHFFVNNNHMSRKVSYIYEGVIKVMYFIEVKVTFYSNYDKLLKFYMLQ